MELLNRYRFIFLFLIGGIFTVYAGNVIWNQKKGPYLDAIYERSSFTLLDDKGNFYGTKELKENERLLLIFVPDTLQVKFVQELAALSSDLELLHGKNIAVALVARVPRDNIVNLKEQARYPGRILLDPSGSLGRIIGIWPDPEPVQLWGYAFIDKHMHILWTTRADHVLQYSEYQEKL